MKLTKRQMGCLHSANRGCGLSYRSACKHGIEQANFLKENGLIYLVDKGEHKDVGRFLFRTTDKGRLIIKESAATGGDHE